MRHAPPRRILIVRLSHLGDVVHALPVYHALRAAHPRAAIGWVVQPEFGGLLEGLRGLSELFHFERKAGMRAWPRLWSELRAFAPDWTIDAQGNVKSAFVTLGSGAGRRSGMHRSDWTEPFGASVLTDCAAPAGRGVHALARIAALVRHVVPEAPSTSVAALRTDPELAAHEIVAGRALYADHVGSVDAGTTILHLAPPGDVRSWPAARYEELALDLARRGRRVLVLSGPAEADNGRELATRLAGETRVRHWVAQRDLRTLAAFFRASAEAGAVFVGCDSGPLHLAAATGLRVVCLAGPQDERRTGPWPLPERSAAGAADAPDDPGSRGHAAVRARNSPACAPCLARRCTHPEGAVCMRDLEPADVVAALL
jgi:heptosyltransferase-1